MTLSLKKNTAPTAHFQSRLDLALETLQDFLKEQIGDAGKVEDYRMEIGDELRKSIFIDISMSQLPQILSFVQSKNGKAVQFKAFVLIRNGKDKRFTPKPMTSAAYSDDLAIQNVRMAATVMENGTLQIATCASYCGVMIPVFFNLKTWNHEDVSAANKRISKFSVVDLNKEICFWVMS